MKSIEEMLNELEDTAAPQANVDSIPSIKMEESENLSVISMGGSLEDLAQSLGIDLGGATIVEPEATTEPVVEEKPKRKRLQAKPVITPEEKAQLAEAKKAKAQADKEAKAIAKAEAQAIKKAEVEAKKLAKAEAKAKADAEKAAKVTETAEEKEVKPKVVKPSFRMDAPIPVTEFRGMTIGVYGNILTPLAEPDKEGYLWAEIPKVKYHPAEHETYRSNGRAVLIINKDMGRYLVGVEENGEFSGIIEVTNRGRGAFRCRQMAQALKLAYLEKSDEIKVSNEEYQQYLAKTPVPKPPVVPEKAELEIEEEKQSVVS